MRKDNTRRFTIVTAAGKEEIYCLDMDDSHEHEVWFIFKDQPPRIFQRAAVISRQEHPLPNREAFRKRAMQANRIYENSYRQP